MTSPKKSSSPRFQLPAHVAPLNVPFFSQRKMGQMRSCGGKSKRGRRGSVLILVVAVLVLLALMGTAYITSTRNDRAASSSAESAASLETLTNGLADQLKSKLAAERISSVAFTGTTVTTSVTGFAHRDAAGNYVGSTLVASRVPTVTSTSSPGYIPTWFTISSPLNASATDPGYFSSPLIAAGTAAATFAGSTINGVSTGSVATWGRTEPARRNVYIGALTVNGQTYPAFSVPASNDNFGTGVLALASGSFVVAADADGDGIADSGLVNVGTIPNPQYGDLTFYYGLRVLDNNSALNVNTAWTNADDYDFAATGSPVRNNRLFPSAIGLKESLARFTTAAAPFTANAASTYDEFDGDGILNSASPFPAAPSNSGANFLGYRAGLLGTTPTPVSNNTLRLRSVPIGDIDVTNGRPKAYIRNDFSFTSQQELYFSQSSSRLDFPGYSAEVSGGVITTNTDKALRPFTLSDQAQLASGFLLAPRDTSDSYVQALQKRPALEYLLAGSLYRFTGHPEATVAQFGIFANMRSTPYSPTQAGLAFSGLNPASTVTLNWFTQNFQYESDPGGAISTFDIFNLRPLVVARNPVAQTTGLKPLPVSLIRNDSATIAGTRYSRMTPYVPIFDRESLYGPGDVVYFYDPLNPTEGPFYTYAWRNRQTTVDTGPDVASNVAANAQSVSVARPWVLYDGPAVPGKVNINTDAFGDLWRGFYLAMSGDGINPADVAGPDLSNGTVSPFGNPVSPYGAGVALSELYRGTASAQVSTITEPADPAYTLPMDPAPSTQSTPTLTNAADVSSFNPNRMFRSNVKDYVDASPTRIPPASMVALRSAQAAVNAEYLRSRQPLHSGTGAPAPGRDDIVRRTIPLTMTVGGADNTTVLAQVYSMGATPFITEVYVSSSPGSTYVAVELYNPYPFDISLANFKFQSVTRAGGFTAPGRTVTDIFTFANETTPATPTLPTIIVPAHSTLVLNNAGTGASTVGTLGAGITTAGPSSAPSYPAITGAAVYVPGLEAATRGATKGELVLTRPLLAEIYAGGGGTAGTIMACLPVTGANNRPVPGTGGNYLVTTPAVIGQEEADYYAPMDSIDLSGVQIRLQFVDATPITWPQINPALPNPAGVAKTRTKDYSFEYHYARSADNWKFVYPGRYDGRAANPLRQQGLREYLARTGYSVSPAIDPTYDQALPPVVVPDFQGPLPTFGTVNDAADTTYTNNFSIQLGTLGQGGPNASVIDTFSAANTNRFPFGAFPRELDMMQVPFISPVRLRSLASATPFAAVSPVNYIDVISLTADAAFAEDADTFDDKEENIGRPVPLIVPRPAIVSPGTFFDEIDETSTNTTKHRYAWATKLLEYLTVRSVRDLALPSAANNRENLTSYSVAHYPHQDAGLSNVLPQPVARTAQDAVSPNKLSGYSAGIEGLININTAPLPVLAAVPWTNTGTAAANRADNIAIAKAIIADRERNGPFPSIFHLNRVHGFRTHNATDYNSPDSAIKIAFPSLNTTLADTQTYGAEQADPNVSSAYTARTHLTNRRGDFSPLNPAAAGIIYPIPYHDTDFFPGTSTGGVTNYADAKGEYNPLADFDSQYLQLTAVSNLLTTRSDTFTAYLVVEGWRNAGTANATRVIQRRFAYLLDRTGAAVALPGDTSIARPVVNPTTASQSAVVNPYNGTAEIRRAANNTVKAVPVPVPASK